MPTHIFPRAASREDRMYVYDQKRTGVTVFAFSATAFQNDANDSIRFGKFDRDGFLEKKILLRNIARAV